MKPSEFVREYLEYAQKTEKQTGISAIFTLAQAALESAWGENAYGNMFFGVKASKNTPENKKQLLRTTEILNNPNAIFPEIISKTQRKDGRWLYVVRDWFRRYDTPEESFTDHAKFFYNKKRYRGVVELATRNIITKSALMNPLLAEATRKNLTDKVIKYPYELADEVAKSGYATEPQYADRLKNVIKTIEKNLPK